MNTQERKTYYMIDVKYHYSPGTFYAPTDGALQDHDGRPIFFESEQDAIDFVEEVLDLQENSVREKSYYPKGTYYLSHGQQDSPDYQIVKRSRKYWNLCTNMSQAENVETYARREW